MVVWEWYVPVGIGGYGKAVEVVVNLVFVASVRVVMVVVVLRCW